MASRNQNRGFAAMDEEEQREISRRGGQASHGGTNNEDSDEGEGGRGAAGSTEAAARGGRHSHGGGGAGNGRSTGQKAKRVITRAVRVLDEIESRIAELRDELEEQGGSEEDGEESGGRRGGRGFAGMDPEERREIASAGGRAAHARGSAHEFDSEEAREAGRQSHKNR